MSINLLRYAQGENISDTLSSSIGSSDTTIPVNTISKWNSNGGNVIIDRGTTSQEIIVVTGVSGSSLVVASGGRGFDGTTAVGHNSGATIESVPFAKDWNDLISALLNLLVIAGTLDTTKVTDLTTAQTLTNKSLSDTTTKIVNVSDATKVIKFDPSAATTGTTMTIASPQTANRTLTLPDATDTVAVLGTPQTYTATQTEKQVVWSNNAITASGNAATVPITSRLNTVTNNSAATLTITMATASAVDGQLSFVRILDASAAAQTISWVNTENSTVSVPTTSNGSTTLFLSVGFIFNGATSKWRCIASA